jgi:hypothetical protein
LFDSTTGYGTSQNFRVIYNPPLQLDQTKQYVIGLISADIWYLWYNVNSTNNILKYYNGTMWKVTVLLPGAYNILDINTEIKRLITANGDVADNITIIPNYNTLKCRIKIRGSYQIDFTAESSIRTVLGFNSKILSTNGTFDGDTNVNITDINSLLIRCSLVSGSYINGSSSDCLYNFSPNLPPGSLISVRPFQIIYLPIDNCYSISEICMRITDQSDREVDLNGERVTYYLHLKHVE